MCLTSFIINGYLFTCSGHYTILSHYKKNIGLWYIVMNCLEQKRNSEVNIFKTDESHINLIFMH